MWIWDVRLCVGMGCQAVGGYGMSGYGWVWDVRLWVGMGCQPVGGGLHSLIILRNFSNKCQCYSLSGFCGLMT